MRTLSTPAEHASDAREGPRPRSRCAREVRELPGYGLGLATIRKVIDAYDGTIQVRSAVGEGTTFTERFPLASGEAPESIAA